MLIGVSSNALLFANIANDSTHEGKFMRSLSSCFKNGVVLYAVTICANVYIQKYARESTTQK